MGQLNFYVTAVNRDIKTEEDKPTIGILIGISKYELTKQLEKEFMSSLPSIEEIERGVRAIQQENQGED